MDKQYFIDDLDRKILRELQQNSDIALSELSKLVGLSPTPCWKRIQKLKESGVILRHVAIVAQDRVGLGLTVFVTLEIHEHSQEKIADFSKKISLMPEVMEFYRMAGDVDYMLRVVVDGMTGYDVFYNKLIELVPLKNVTSRIALECIKFTTTQPIPYKPVKSAPNQANRK